MLRVQGDGSADEDYRAEGDLARSPRRAVRLNPLPVESAHLWGLRPQTPSPFGELALARPGLLARCARSQRAPIHDGRTGSQVGQRLLEQAGRLLRGGPR